MGWWAGASQADTRPSDQAKSETPPTVRTHERTHTFTAKKALAEDAGETAPRAPNFPLEPPIVTGFRIRIMAKVTYGPTTAEARGKAADVVYTKSRGGNVIRSLKLTPAQLGAGEGCAAYNNAAQGIPTGAWTPINFQAEYYDNGDLHDDVTNNTRLTAKLPGVYILTGSATFDIAAVGERLLSIKINNTVYIVHGTYSPPAADTTHMSIATLFHLVKGDYIELLALQTTAGNLNINAGTNDRAIFAMQQLTGR